MNERSFNLSSTHYIVPLILTEYFAMLRVTKTEV